MRTTTRIQPGGPVNPLGARALYLCQNGAGTGFRIIGTNQPRTIGPSVSNGCNRILREHVAGLCQRVPLGTVATVLRAPGRRAARKSAGCPGEFLLFSLATPAIMTKCVIAT
ncbi:L,D-transpeptidase [Cribrihabitans pelagius]|uniref:L,D-transpeptidase n=1 Tax=Cribrihabitans pelagius TaxID=1765746 RepID=UPI003B5BAA93